MVSVERIAKVEEQVVEEVLRGQVGDCGGQGRSHWVEEEVVVVKEEDMEVEEEVISVKEKVVVIEE